MGKNNGSIPLRGRALCSIPLRGRALLHGEAGALSSPLRGLFAPFPYGEGLFAKTIPLRGRLLKD